MGRMIKNAVPKTASHSIAIPVSIGSSIGPDSPVSGQLYFRNDTNKLEYWSSNSSGSYPLTPSLYSIAKEGNVTIVKDSFSGNSVQNTFTMSRPYNSGSEAQCLIFVGQVYQNPGVAYTFNGTTTITFTAPPASGTDNILLLHNFASTTVTQY